MSPRRLFIAFWVWMAVLVILYTFMTPARIVSWALIGVSSVAAVITGIVINKPRRRLPWIFVAAALIMFTLGDAVFFLETRVLGHPDTFPSANDIVYLSMYPLLTVGLLLLPRATTRRDRGGVVDALILTTGIGLLAWIFIIGPELEKSTRPVSIHLAAIAYPLFDLLFLAAAARLLTEVRRTVAVTLMAIGGVALLFGDVVYSIYQVGQAWHGLGGLSDVGWIVFYVTWGAAALHPSMRELTEPRVVPDHEVTAPRLTMLTVSALIAPTVLIVQPILRSSVDTIPVAIISAALFVLVLLRLAVVVGSYRQSLRRERSLRRASSALVSAANVDTVRSVVISAVGQLFPPGVRYEVALPLKEDTLSDETLDLAYREEAVRKPQPPRFLSTQAIHAARLRHMRSYELAFVVPLIVTGRAVGEPLIGTLVVASDERSLADRQSTLEALGAQAALAIERISLNAEVARRNSEQYFRTLVQSTADVILIIDEDDTIRYASPSAATVFGPEELAGRAIVDLVVMDERERALRVLEHIRSGEISDQPGYWRVQRSDSRDTLEVEVTYRDLRAEPTVHGLVFTVRDVTERVRLQDELSYLAYHDTLTGLPNRERFGERVEQALRRADLEHRTVGVLFIDLDDFKVVNNTVGHDAGDTLLSEVGQRLSTVVDDSGSDRSMREVVARLGGDEFAVLVASAADATAVEAVAQRVLDVFAEPYFLNGGPLNVSASVGVATTVDAHSREDLLRQADLALYVAKDAGKSRWRRYQPAQHTALLERLELRSALDRAIHNNEFVLAYQPIVSLRENAPTGFEALLRWHDPTRGVVSPSAFIDVAEDSGLIVPIGSWAMHQAMADAARWPVVNGHAPYISINVSVRQFRSAGLMETIEQSMRSAGLAPERLVLEITESLLLRDDERVWSDLVRLRDRGVRIAIDDFGTGYSSLSYLRQVPIDVLKVDKSFIDTMAASEQQLTLVETIVRLANTLGLSVVAEGIQRGYDRDLLVAMGCSYGQGFLFAGPMSFDDSQRWLRERASALSRLD